MQYLAGHPERTVSDVARDVKMPLTAASEYLRALNARGLLRANRDGRWVLYRMQADPGVPHAGVLLRALASTFRARAQPLEEAFAALTGFTHPRRIALAQALAGGPLDLKTLRRQSGISVQAALRHLRKLGKRGYVLKRGDRYVCGHPRTPLAKALLDLAVRTA